MLRSFNYAIQLGLKEFQSDDLLVRNALQGWANVWEAAVRSEFLSAYRHTIAEADLFPTDEASFDRMLTVLELEKAIYELEYEINNRPDWINVPLMGILALSER